MFCRSTLLLLLALPVGALFADATIPTRDIPGSQDEPSLGRYTGSFIVSRHHQDFDELTLPLSKLEEVEDARDSHNNRVFAPARKITLEGAATRLVYVMPEQVSPLEVLRNYQQAIEDQGGEILFECKDHECGGDANRASEGGGGEMSLAMFLRDQDRIRDEPFSNGNCAQTMRIRDQRYLVGQTDDPDLYVSVLVYTVNTSAFCKALADRTVAVLDVIRPRERTQKMMVVKAEEMAEALADHGSIALYGIHFDTNRTDIKPDSRPALEQIARLLKEQPGMKLLVVGHTDNVGTFAFNQDLSQRRAAAVVSALVSEYGIARERLTGVGVSYASPVASNRSEEGRAKNRRVELVED